MKPFPDPDASASSDNSDPTAASWNIKDNDAKTGANGAAGEAGGADFTPTIRKGVAQLFKVTPDSQIVESQQQQAQQQPLPSNSGKKVN